MKKNFKKEKDELLKTEKTFGSFETEISENLELSKRNLNTLKKRT